MRAARTILGTIAVAGLFAFNLALPEPADAGLTDNFCLDAGEWVPCCTFCILFCDCGL